MTRPSGLDGFARTYGVELLCSDRPKIGKRALIEAVRRRGSNLAPLDGDSDSDLLAFVFPEHKVRYQDGSLPAQLFLAQADKSLDSGLMEDAIRQSWGCPDARERIARCTTTVLVTDLMSSGLEYRSRLLLYQQALAGILDVVPALAVHWRPTQQIIDPKHFLAALDERPAPNPLAGAVNVRLFDIQDTDGEHVMDSLGLSALGLCDVQCHFRGIEPNEIARLLFNLATYLFDQGDVIQDGHAVEGIPPDSKWRCQHERSLVPPDRVVLDVDPGPTHAAGKRRRM